MVIVRLLLSLVALLCTALPAAAAQQAPAVPAERPAKGLVYDGLVPARAGGPCEAGHFEIRHAARALGCTHGPDAAPAGVDVTDRPTTAELAEADPESSAPIPCLDDGVSGYRVQAIYAYPAGTASRFSTVAPSIRDWAGSNVDAIFDASAQETGGTRHVRFVTESTGTGCQVDVDEVALSSRGDDSFDATISELEALGYDDANRKYLVWMDSNVYCGIGQVYSDDRASSDNWNNGNAPTGMVARVDARCWGSTGVPAEAHELMHTLGGVQDSAPNSTARFGGAAGGHCSDEYDVMCYDDDGTGPSATTIVCSNTSGNRRFDCGHDDYFHTHPPSGSYLARHWNTADSRFLDGALPVLAPANDAFSEAEQLDGERDASSGTNVGATRESGEPLHAGNTGGSSVWYRWTAPRSATATITTAGSAFDTLLGVYTGSSVGALAPVAGNDDVSDGVLTSSVSFPAVAGQVYRIAVDGWSGSAGVLAVDLALAGSPETVAPSPAAGPPTVTLTASKRRVSAGARVVLTAAASRCGPGDALSLRSKTRTWSRGVDGSCSASFRVRMRRTTTFQAFAGQTGSNVVRVRVRL